MKIIHLIVGARPNFMKIAPIYKLLKGSEDFSPIIVHTGQHSDYNMSEVFYDLLGISKPHICLNAGGKTNTQQIANIMLAYEEKVIKNPKPHLVVVVGDVNSTLACALTAKNLGLKIAHIEAGLRSFDMSMPEETNRVLVDGISDYLFVTEESGIKNLKNQGVKGKVFFVGNVMIDTLYECIRTMAVFHKSNKYAVVTLHRPSNVDNRERLEGILEALAVIAKDMPVIFPVHPRTKARLEEYGLMKNNGITFQEPKSYVDFLRLWVNSELVLTDSGGLQEETTAMSVPCFTIRENTERPATIDKGSNRLVGVYKHTILKAYDEFKHEYRCFNIPYLWDGYASDRIVKTIGGLI